MYGFSRFYKYPLPLLFLSLWLVAVFLLSNKPAHSQHAAISNKEKYQLDQQDSPTKASTPIVGEECA
jgi:zinc protease